MENGQVFTADSGRRYEVIEPIAKAGESEVFKVFSVDEEDNPIRALKEYAKEIGLINRFNNELETLCYLNTLHSGEPFPGVSRVYDSSRRDNFLILNYVDGKDFRWVIDEKGEGNFSNLEIFALTSRFSGILSELLYRGNISHRDVKPENILLENSTYSFLKGNNSHGDDLLINLEEVQRPGNVYLCDFTLSFKDGRSEVHEQKKPGYFLGTPQYCSPEVWHDEKSMSPADVWALGIIAYEMISREGPYSGLSTIEDLYIHHKNKLPLPKIERELFGFESLVYGMTEREPENRPSMDEIHKISTEYYRRFAELESIVEQPIEELGDNNDCELVSTKGFMSWIRNLL